MSECSAATRNLRWISTQFALDQHTECFDPPSPRLRRTRTRNRPAEAFSVGGQAQHEEVFSAISAHASTILLIRSLLKEAQWPCKPNKTLRRRSAEGEYG